MADDLVLEQLKVIRRDMATKADLSNMATKTDLASATATTHAELESLRGELTRHFVEVETRITTEVHELISLLRELVTSRDKLATRISQLESDFGEMKRRTG